MMSYSDNVRAVLEVLFNGFKEEIIERAVSRIVELHEKRKQRGRK